MDGKVRLTIKVLFITLLEDAAAFTGNTDSDMDLEGASEMASDRKLWREMIRHKRESIGAGHSND